MRHRALTDDLRDRAALYSVGALEQAEATEFESHLRDGCEICGAEVRSFGAAAAFIGLAAPEAQPDPALRSRLLERIRPRDKCGLAEVEPGMHVLRAGEGAWRRTPFHGVAAKLLYVDPHTSLATQLVRMAPGAHFPAHRHSDVEQCLVLEGELKIGGVVLHAGDYGRAAAATNHTIVTTELGCTLLIVASQHDEYASAP